MSLTILLLGRDGQVAWELRRTLAPLGALTVLGRREVDLAVPDQIRAAIRAHRPAVVVNAAAYTAVDRAEGDVEGAMAVNAVAPGVIAEEAAQVGARMVHYSTDYVFDGTKGSPYEVDDEVGPRSVYGRSKLEGERAVRQATDAHLIFRTSWVYGTRGSNFLRTLLRLFRERDEVRVVADQVGSPTWSRMIAEVTAQALGRGHRERAGTYHLVAGGDTTWHGFASAIHAALGAGTATQRVTAIRTHEYPLPAPRPAYSVLSTKKLERDFGLVLPDWKVSLQQVVEEIAGANAAG